MVSNETSSLGTGGTATVINLNGATFSGADTGCSVNEAGTLPNSVLVRNLPNLTAGSALNHATHQAFLTAENDSGITLLGLPSTAAAQLTAGQISAQTSNLPANPNNRLWSSKDDPAAVAVASCITGNMGYTLNSSFSFLAQVDLDTLRLNPGAIGTALPAGNCAGTSTTLSCSNGNGVTFFPLPP